MKTSQFLAGLGKTAFLSVASIFVLVPMAVTVLGGFKSNGDLRENPFGLPQIWDFSLFSQILAQPSFWSYLAIRWSSRWGLFL